MNLLLLEELFLSFLFSNLIVSYLFSYLLIVSYYYFSCLSLFF
jgi:hypothetical protein